MSMMTCDFCERLVDTDSEYMEPVCDNQKIMCEGCYTECIEHVEATLTEQDIRSIRAFWQGPDADEEIMCDMVGKIDGHPLLEDLHWIDFENLIGEVA